MTTRDLPEVDATQIQFKTELLAHFLTTMQEGKRETASMVVTSPSSVQEIWSTQIERDAPTTPTIFGSSPLAAARLESQAIFLLARQVAELRKEIQQLRTELMSKTNSYSILLNDLADETYSVVAPISIVIDESDEDILARWPETRAYGMGDTLAEALARLKENIIELHGDLASRDPNTLGKIALKTLRTLERYVRRNQ